MIIVMKRYANKKNVESVIKKIEDAGLKPVPLYGVERTVIAVIGDERTLHIDSINALPDVDKVMRVLKPYKLVSREYQENNSIIKVNGFEIGGKKIIIMAGPCAVESEERIIEIAREVKKAGANILRGGAYKPRTAPYDFQGLGEDGLKYLLKAKNETGLPIVTEVTDPAKVEIVAKYADILQIGTRNMQNFELLKAAGRTKKTVLLKRGMSATYNEFLLAAEYIMSEGNPNVILCERGIRTFETSTRNTLDLNIIPVIKKLSHLPIFVDPSHGTGKRDMVIPMSKAAIAAGADGLIIEVHTHPDEAVTDADQTISMETFEQLMKELEPVAKAVGRTL